MIGRIRTALDRAGLLVSVRGVLPDIIAGITDDSRQVQRGHCFVAVPGTASDGHAFLGAAVQAGASCVILEDERASPLPALVVRDGRAAAAVAAAAFYDEPARALRFVGVTGTNGKTTTVGILRHLLDAPNAPAASIGTLGVLIGSVGTPLPGWAPGGAGLTTPGPIELQRTLRALVEVGVRWVAMEVSSHALDQRRVLGVSFDAAVFTNLTRDHLDYHGSMDAYFAAKARLLDLLTPDGTAVVNADDPAWSALGAAPHLLRFGLTAVGTDLRAADVSFGLRGSAGVLRSGEDERAFQLPLIGDFNVANALGAAAAAIAVGRSLELVASRLATLPQVPGRLEVLAERPTVLRDYAHTPDALERALVALRPFITGRLIVLFGCGGDRDRGKRPLMALAARAHADHLVVTSDNPRTEDPEAILDEIVAALDAGSFDRIEDRRTAIAHALALADPERDMVLLAGKGHETYQIRGRETFPFDEKTIVHQLLSGATPADAREPSGEGGR